MPSKKKRTPWKKSSLILAAILVPILLLGGYYFFSSQDNAPPPTFRFQGWMSLVPNNIERFRFLNMTDLRQFPELFISPVVLSIPELQRNISIYELAYGLEIETSSNSIINILGMNATIANPIAGALSNAGLPYVSYKNATIHQIRTSNNPQADTAWISIFKGVLIYSE